MEKPTEEVVVEEKQVEKKIEDEGEKEKEKKVHFPKALMKKNLEKQFAKFVSMFKKL